MGQVKDALESDRGGLPLDVIALFLQIQRDLQLWFIKSSLASSSGSTCHSTPMMKMDKEKPCTAHFEENGSMSDGNNDLFHNWGEWSQVDI